jgi:hypothetical protein
MATSVVAGTAHAQTRGLSIAPLTALTAHLTHSRSSAAAQALGTAVDRQTVRAVQHESVGFHGEDAGSLSSASMKLPEADFSPATIVKEGEVSASSPNLGAAHPSKGAGIAGGYFQTAGVLTPSNDPIAFAYQGSFFADVAHAGTYFSEMTDPHQSDCTSLINLPCTMLPAVDPAAGIVGVYMVAQVNQCVVEALTGGPVAAVQANVDSISKLEAIIFVAGVQNAVQVCTASVPPPTQPQPQPQPQPTTQPGTQPGVSITSFTVTHVYVEKATARNDSSHITFARRGKTVTVAVDFHVDSAPASAAVTLKYSATMKGHQVWSKSVSGTLTSGNAAGDYRMTVPYHLGSHAGSATVAASVTISNATGRASTPFRIKK